MKILLLCLAFLGLAALTQAAAPAAPKVSLYYESLCPYCHAFFLQQLAPTAEALKGHITIELVPFGNVKVTETSSGTRLWHCQHGEAECYGNKVHSCGLAHIKDETTAFAFIKCNFAAPNYRDTHHVGEKCAKDLHQDWPTIKACVDGAEGEKLIEANWRKTASLVPRKTGVPWIVVDGKHTDVIAHEARNHLLVFLCTKYLHGQGVAACHGH